MGGLQSVATDKLSSADCHSLTVCITNFSVSERTLKPNPNPTLTQSHPMTTKSSCLVRTKISVILNRFLSNRTNNAGWRGTVCTLLPCSTVLFSAVNVYVIYEQIIDGDDDDGYVVLVHAVCKTYRTMGTWMQWLKLHILMCAEKLEKN